MGSTNQSHRRWEFAITSINSVEFLQAHQRYRAEITDAVLSPPEDFCSERQSQAQSVRSCRAHNIATDKTNRKNRDRLSILKAVELFATTKWGACASKPKRSCRAERLLRECLRPDWPRERGSIG